MSNDERAEEGAVDDGSAALPGRIPSRNVAVRISPDAVRQVRGGSPWIYDGSIDSVSFDADPGTIAVLFDRKRDFVGVGLYDPLSPIRVKVLHQGTQVVIDDRLIIDRIVAAARRRTELFADLDRDGRPLNTAGRLVHGENDGLGGLVVDRYDATAVVKLYSLAWASRLGLIVDALDESWATVWPQQQPLQRVVLRLARTVAEHETELERLIDGERRVRGTSMNERLHSSRPGDGSVIFGAAVDGPIMFRENGLLFEADVIAGQKTGHFLDQRDNRAKVRELAGDDEVLDVFASTGGFSVAALAGGAASVTLIDQSPNSLATAQANLQHNGFDAHAPVRGWAATLDEPDTDARTTSGGKAAPTAHDTRGHGSRGHGSRATMVIADAFAALADIASTRRTFDMVIVDPPSFASSNASVSGALNSYGRLTELALAVLRPGGVLVQCSCSSRISADEFFGTVHLAAERAGRPLSEFGRTFHPIDHPVGFEYGAYLKALFAYVP